jgi:hypothetical protein
VPGYTSVSQHDGWAVYRAYTACRHALHNVQHPCELTFVEQEYHQPWAGQLRTLLQEMQAAADQVRAQGLRHAPTVQQSRCRAQSWRSLHASTTQWRISGGMMTRHSATLPILPMLGTPYQAYQAL